MQVTWLNENVDRGSSGYLVRRFATAALGRHTDSSPIGRRSRLLVTYPCQSGILTPPTTYKPVFTLL